MACLDALAPGLEWVEELLPRVLPDTWCVINEALDGRAFQHERGLRVIMSGATELDGRRWLHVSCSRSTRLPTWEDLKIVKNLFIGEERDAVQVLPRQSRYINIHPYVLHLWHCIDGEPLPDFTHGGDTI